MIIVPFLQFSILFVMVEKKINRISNDRFNNDQINEIYITLTSKNDRITKQNINLIDTIKLQMN